MRGPNWIGNAGYMKGRKAKPLTLTREVKQVSSKVADGEKGRHDEVIRIWAVGVRGKRGQDA